MRIAAANNRFDGVHAIGSTPFTNDGTLDLPSLATLPAFSIARDVEGLIVLSVMGEAPKLEERDDVLRTTAAAAGGRVPVFAGAGTDLAIARGKCASLSATSYGWGPGSRSAGRLAACGVRSPAHSWGTPARRSTATCGPSRAGRSKPGA